MIRASRQEQRHLRGVAYNIRMWGDAKNPPLFLVHGLRDSSATFQFLVDGFHQDWFVIAPDLRGHGGSDRANTGYWLHDFVADLDIILHNFADGQPVPVVGHSLGGNVATILASLHPGRFSHLVSLDGFGPLVRDLPVAPKALLEEFLNRLADTSPPRSYDNLHAAAAQLMNANQRLPLSRALFLAEQGCVRGGEGLYRWRFDPLLRRSLPTLRDLAEWVEIWGSLRLPVMWIGSQDTRPDAPRNHPGALSLRRDAVPGLRWREIAETGHNLHHDAPEEAARMIEDFLCRDP